MNDGSFESYFSEEGEHYSTLKEMGKSPIHFAAAVEAEKRRTKGSTEAQELGTAFHWACLEPAKFAARITIWPSRHGKRSGAVWDRTYFEAQKERKIILTEEDHERVITMARAFRSSPQVEPYLEGKVETEKSLTWTDPATGLKCKCRIDLISKPGILDLKSTKDGSPEGFGREAARYSYHRQAGMYVDGYAATHCGLELPFAFAAIEKEPPFVVQVYKVAGDVLELGRQEMRGYLKKLAELRAKPVKDWPGYAEGPIDLALPRWAFPYEDNSLDGLDLEGVAFEGSSEL